MFVTGQKLRETVSNTLGKKTKDLLCSIRPTVPAVGDEGMQRLGSPRAIIVREGYGPLALLALNPVQKRRKDLREVIN
jgi:hypothetical protein